MLPWIICGILLIVVIILLLKIHMLQKCADEICDEFKRFLKEDTNVLISVSTQDKHIRRLANDINTNLKELRKLELQYKNGDKELKEAVTNISHDLRTPLTAIYGYIDLLEKAKDNDEIHRYTSLIRERADAMKQLTEELFAYSIIASVPDLEYYDVNICRILEEALVSFYGEMQLAGIIPDISMPEKPIIKKVDANALRRVFSNIISNAIKYSDGDFEVKILDNSRIVFSNTAKKLSTVEVGKLFDRFYTVDSARKSTGIGLSIAKLLVERMGGNITACYEQGRLCITIIL